ncbi:uncharacterized protein TRIADDRAFT_24883 [Trichoplax adhaerens]|uniref:Uncharacterized protein n=1 Tax=Trichoplax adhaerens TaxID=10228 RepID=B3RXP9_TRIAD|nr:hypothetical protein TRIADDRAFT_24883 [Trichoplax adhaerens]EDV24894.1 hypothetical protein TRIADDRAFT_24883 [Trichoplax adhaerens]|eukprot:XP_002112784.1 hypothetical protein TRIADDRAFT_24883 [Trichoplax adhaerens]
MANISISRVKREFAEVVKSEEAKRCGICIKMLNENNFTKLLGEITGPPDTPYEGGKFLVDIEIPDSYPFNPPKMKFITRIWHPNISSVTGAICLDILKDNWAAALTLRTVLMSLQVLLSAAEPDDPQDAVVAKQYNENIHLFMKTARHWSEAYAKARPIKTQDFHEKVRKLSETGFSDDSCRTALSKSGWDEQRGMETLLDS